jgi:S1-C subfamily serine protease
MNKILCLFTIIFLLSCANQRNIKEDYEYLQNVSVGIKIPGSGYGSGIMITRDGTNYVWTCGHVVDDAIKMENKEVDGKMKLIISFDDILVSQELNEDHAKSIKISRAKVIKYSPTMDLALLKVEQEKFSSIDAKFHLGNEVFYPLTPIYHVGSYLDVQDSFSEGIISKNNVMNDNDFLLDQTSAVIYPGSSGSGIYLRENLDCIGIVRSAIGENCNYMIPIRFIESWSEKNGVLWALDPSVPVDEDIEITPSEESIDAVLMLLSKE